jgi:hypothetical protein
VVWELQKHPLNSIWFQHQIKNISIRYKPIIGLLLTCMLLRILTRLRVQDLVWTIGERRKVSLFTVSIPTLGFFQPPEMGLQLSGLETDHSTTPSATVLFLIGTVGGGVQLGPFGTAATNRTIVPAPGDYDDGKIGGMIGRGNRSARRKPAPVPLCPPQTPHAARTRTRAAAVRSQRLTA